MSENTATTADSKSGSSVAISVVHMIVDDPDAAAAFYRDNLGLSNAEL